MTDKPQARQAHIRRYIGTNKKGEKLTDLYADMYRIDNYVTKTYGAAGPIEDEERADSQTVLRSIFWKDGPGEELPDGTFEIVKLIGPDENQDNPEEWIEIPAITVTSTNSQLLTATGQGDDQVKQTTFHNPTKDDDKGSQRQGYIVKLTHFDTNYDNDPNLKYGGIIDVDKYEKKKGTEDKDQYVYSCITQQYTVMCSHQNPNGNGDDQLMKRLTHNEFMLDEYKLTKAPTNIEAPPFNPPWIWDPLQTLINYQNGSLAVKFYGKESWIQLATKIPATKKLTLVIWFRVPQSSINAAKAEYDDWVDAGGPRPTMLGIIPIMTSGPPSLQKVLGEPSIRSFGTRPGQSYVWVGEDSGGWVTNGDPFSNPLQDTIPTFSGSTFVTDPTYIGIDCTGDIPQLSVNIVMPRDDVPTFEGTFPLATAMSADEDGIYTQTGPSGSQGPFNYIDPTPAGDTLQMDLVDWGPLSATCHTETEMLDSKANVNLGQFPETYRTLPNATLQAGLDHADPDYVGQRITANHWHCLQFSIDVSNLVKVKGAYAVKHAISPVHGPRANGYTLVSGSEATPETVGTRVSSASRMFIALDDNNLTGTKLSCYYPQGYKDTNAILPVNGYYVASDTTFELTNVLEVLFGRLFTSHVKQKQGLYQYIPSKIPLDKGDLSFPAHHDYLSSTKTIELGECTAYIGEVVDWSKETARRAWLTAEGKPANINDTAKFMGRRPDVVVHGSANWKQARDSGLIATQAAAATGTDLAKGTKDGRIETYRPSPNLFGEQGN